MSLYHQLNAEPVSYLHLPLAVDRQGNKLSKQNHATAIDLQHPQPTLIRAMEFLGFELTTEIKGANIEEIIHWGIQNWSREQLPLATELTSPFSNAAL
jgi:glutamyl-Q tRNA(Asp) synthetase